MQYDRLKNLLFPKQYKTIPYSYNKLLYRCKDPLLTRMWWKINRLYDSCNTDPEKLIIYFTFDYKIKGKRCNRGGKIYKGHMNYIAEYSIHEVNWQCSIMECSGNETLMDKIIEFIVDFQYYILKNKGRVLDANFVVINT